MINKLRKYWILNIIALMFITSCTLATKNFNDPNSPDYVGPFGFLDTSFNKHGYQLYHVDNGYNRGLAVTLDNDGKILVAGCTKANPTADFDMAIWRFNQDGSPDYTFNGTCCVIHNNAAGGNGDDIAYAIAIDSEKRILVAGVSDNDASPTSINFDMVIWRYNPDGSPDYTFNGTGYVKHGKAAGGDGDDYAKSIAVDSDKKIIAAGFSRGTDNDYPVIWKFNPDGSPDSTFTDSIHSGFVVLNVPVNSSNYSGESTNGFHIKVDSSGYIFLAGNVYSMLNSSDMVLWKINKNGSLCSSFNNNGYISHNSAAGGNKDDIPNDLAIDSDGSIYVTGTSCNSDNNLSMVIWKIKPDGTLDTGFNKCGWLTYTSVSGTEDIGRAIAIDHLQRIVVTGSSKINGIRYLTTWRYNSDATPDIYFNLMGFLSQNGSAGYNGSEVPNGIVIDSKKRIVISGETEYSHDNYDMLVLRYR